MKKANCVFLIGFILFLNLLSLNGSSPSQSTNLLESASDRADDPLKVGTTSLGHGIEYILDPAKSEDRALIDIIDQVWEGLYAHNFGDPRLRIIPRLAADCGSWNENATVFNVTLRSGITFHNGEPFTAADVNYTFSRLWELSVFHDRYVREEYFPYGFNTTEMNASLGYGFIINKTVIVDDLHVSFQLNFPYVPFQSLLCSSGSYIVDASTTYKDRYLRFANIVNHTAIGTGPYKVTEFTNDQCNFEYWENYYRGTPAIKKIRFIKYAERYTAITDISEALIHGYIDIPRSFDLDRISDFERKRDIYVGPYREKPQMTYILMNNLNISRTFRHAINYAIDYDKFINEIYNKYSYFGNSKRMTSIVPPGITYHKECDVPIFNITKSRQILIEAGYTEGYSLDVNSTDEEWKNVAESDNPLLDISYFFIYGNPINDEISYLIRDVLKDIGICVNIAAYPNYMFMSFPDLSKKHDMVLVSLTPDYNDPSLIINKYMSNTSYRNYGHVNDSWLQIALEEALTITNDDDRKALYKDIQDYIATDLMPGVFTAYHTSRNVRANYVITQPNPMDKLYIFPFSWHGVNTTFNDSYLELWCNSGSPPVHEYWPEPREHISGYPMMFISICFLVFIPLWIKKNKKKPEI